MISNTKIIYPGRFQPFGPHHFQVYQKLCNSFGKENVFIATSDKTDDDKNPLNFQEKRRVISKYGIDNVVSCKSPYKAEEILTQFNPKTTSVIFVYGEKDAGRISYYKKDGSKGYFSKWIGQAHLEPYEITGYVFVLPHISLSNNGSQINSTLLRQILPGLTETEFKGIMGWYDRDIQNLFQTKFHSDIHEVASRISLDENKITKTQLQRIEQYADRLFKEFGIDINFQNIYQGTHFYQRLNDPRNLTPITLDDLRNLFRKTSLKYGNQLSKENPNSEGVLKDMSSDVNLPFIIKWDRENRELDLIPKTIMKKKDFSTTSKIFTVENFRNVLSAGTYTKHLCHPYDDKNLTKQELSELIYDLFSNPEEVDCSIKYDGHNFQVTYKDGQVLASRNKGTIINPMTIHQVRQKFSDRPDLEESFTGAHRAISDQIFQANCMKIFNNGRTFLNFEIIHPKARNIYDYGNEPFLSLHSLITYDELGNEVSRTNKVPKILEGDQNGWKIQITPKVQLQLPSESNKYFQEKLEKFDSNQLKLLILELGNYIIRNLSIIDENNNIANIIELILDSRDLANKQGSRDKYDSALEDLKALGGFNSINPIEGLVIQWRNRIYKFTGTFGALVPIFSIHNKHRYQG